MRIWDIDPGYLNRESLLGEHRELHGIVAILRDGKKGYSRHPETLRWVGLGWALAQRHRLLASEMALRRYRDRTAVTLRARRGAWPATYIDAPGEQIVILRRKYVGREPGRLRLPRGVQELWSQHELSVLARNPEAHRQLARLAASRTAAAADLGVLARELTEILRQPPTPAALREALERMQTLAFGAARAPSTATLSSARLLRRVQREAMARAVRPLVSSTALGELAAWID
jgi:pyrimidine dimer DNA glycosylase